MVLFSIQSSPNSDKSRSVIFSLNDNTVGYRAPRRPSASASKQRSQFMHAKPAASEFAMAGARFKVGALSELAEPRKLSYL